MLQELLNLGLVDIGSEDSRFEKMQTAASALAMRFREEPHLLIPATLLALDEEVDEDDPFFLIVEEIVVTEWRTLRNTHLNRPRQLLRSITIDALATASAESADVSSIMWCTGAPLVRHQQVRVGKSVGLINNLLAQAFEKAESEAVKRAGMSSPRSKRRTKKATGGVSSLTFTAKIEDKEISADVARAVGPTNSQGEGLPDPNPHWSNQPQHWSYEFSPRMTTAVVKAVNIGTSRLAESIAKGLATHLASLEKHVVEELSSAELLQVELEQNAASGRMRLDVLWWSQARYSSSLKTGYRDLAPPVLAVVAAVDLAAIVPPLAPNSVAYVLAEMVADIVRADSTSESKLPLENYLQSLAEASLNVGDLLPENASYQGRSPLLELVRESAAGVKVSSDRLHKGAGIDSDLHVTPADLAIWVFRDIQARRMVEALS